MGRKTGGGAATASGMSYQARVAAYLLFCVLTDDGPYFADHRHIESVGLETSENVDDIRLRLSGDEHIYLQVKRKLDFSFREGSDLRSALNQFVAQLRVRREMSERYCLVTTSESSGRIIRDLRLTLDALRVGTEENFRKDQNGTLVALLDEIHLALSTFELSAGPLSSEERRLLLQRAQVVVLDVESDSSFEQALIIRLAAAGFASADLLWSKLIADSLGHASSRRTVTANSVRSTYAPFKIAISVDSTRTLDERASKFFQVNFVDFDFQVGREIVLGRVAEGAKKLQKVGITDGKDQLLLLEFHRFDENCQPRIGFKNGRCYMANGVVLDLVRRTATYAGMNRFIQANAEKLTASELIIGPANSTKDLEEGICASKYKRLLRDAALHNDRIMDCVHCGKPVTSSDTELVECDAGGELVVGVSHENCTRTDDRVIGTISSEFFCKYDFLHLFDAQAWFTAIRDGQGAFRTADVLKEGHVMFWAGRMLAVNEGDYVVEILLEDETSEFAFRRGRLQRFAKPHAERFASDLEGWIKKQIDAGDPLCFSHESKAFAAKSQLLNILGGRERLRQAVAVQVRKFERRLSSGYSFWSNWYAPVAYLRFLEDESLFGVASSVVLLTKPLELGNHLENWAEAGMRLPRYEVVILKNDREFDDFAESTFNSGMEFLIDPLFGFGEELILLSGKRLVSQSQFLKDSTR